MLSQRSVPDGIAANPIDDDVQILQRQIQSVEAQAAALTQAMQRMHGGEWRYLIDPIAKNVFVTQFSPAGVVRKRR